MSIYDIPQNTRKVHPVVSLVTYPDGKKVERAKYASGVTVVKTIHPNGTETSKMEYPKAQQNPQQVQQTPAQQPAERPVNTVPKEVKKPVHHVFEPKTEVLQNGDTAITERWTSGMLRVTNINKYNVKTFTYKSIDVSLNVGDSESYTDTDGNKITRTRTTPYQVRIDTKRLKGADTITWEYSNINQYGGYNNIQRVPPVPSPTDTENKNILSVVLFNQSDLNGISDICQPAAGASEFQVHYRALVTRVKHPNGTELILSIPTAFYNFKQKVKRAEVDFHLNDVDEAAEACKELSDTKVQEILQKVSIVSALHSLTNAGLKVDIYEANSGSMHRHPGRFGFSGTDYMKNPTNPGIIYRQKECTDFVQTDSVLFVPTKANTEIFTTETRIIDAKPSGTGVEGTYCHVPTVSYVYGDESLTTKVVDVFAEFLGTTTDTDVSGFLKISSKIGKVKEYPLISEALKSYKASGYDADITNVHASHITNAGYQHGAINYAPRYGGGASLYDDFDSYYNDDDDLIPGENWWR